MQTAFSWSSSLLELWDNQETCVPGAARILWYSAAKTPSQQLRDTTLFGEGIVNLSHFVARNIWWRCGVSPLLGRDYRLQRREPRGGLLVRVDIILNLRQTAIN